MPKPSCFTGLLSLLVLSWASVAAPAEKTAEKPADAEPAPVTVLDGTSVWRVLHSFGAPVIEAQDGAEAIKTGTTFRPKGQFNFMTVYPKAGWQAVDFDDSDWPRMHFWQKYYNGQSDPRAHGGGPNVNIRQVTLRGQFTVTDPKEAKDLSLTFVWRGGVVVYLNDTEIARSHVGQGDLEPGSPAEMYKRVAYLKENGKPWHWHRDSKEIKPSYEERLRRIENLTIRSKLLRKGTNVLAIEIHAAPWPKEFSKKKVSPPWASAGFCELRLQTLQPDVVVPNVVRPKGFQVWNTSPLEVVLRNSYGDPHESLKPVRLYATRNGHATGRVVASSDAPIKGFKAAVTPLTGAGGRQIPADRVAVSYGRVCKLNKAGARDDAMCPTPASDLTPPPIPPHDRWTKARHNARRADGLPLEFTPGIHQSVLVTVNVPADADPGDYKGTLSIDADGEDTVEIPVELSVARWPVPDPKDFTTFYGLIQSPEGVTMPYKDVELWSDEHVELLDKSFDLIARTGGKVLFIHLTAETEYGNEYSMVVWDKGADGKLKPDLSAVETFVKTATKHIRPTFVPVCVWQWVGKGKAPRITVRGTDGKLSNVDGPVNGTKEAEAFWRPVLTEVREILARHDLADAMLLATGSDRYPKKETVEVFNKILPGVGWEAHRHFPRSGDTMAAVEGHVPVKYIASVWGSWHNWDPADKRVYGWRYTAGKGDTFWCWLDRRVYDNAPLPTFRVVCEQPLLANRRGLAQVGADFWPAPAPKGVRGHSTLYSRFPRSANVGGGNKGCTTNQLFYPYKDGPVPTIRYEMVRENVEACEARIFLEKVLTIEPCPLPEKVAKNCQAVLDKRTRWHRIAYGMRQPGAQRLWAYSGWDARRHDLFEAAADAAKHTKKSGDGRAAK